MRKKDENTHLRPSFSLTNRALRVLWGLVSLFFFTYTPRPFHKWRAIILKIFGAKIGKHTRVYGKAVIWAPWNLILADGCVIANDVIVYSQGIIQVGKNAVVSQGTNLCTGTHDYTKRGFPLVTKPIIIGDHAWVAAEAFIHPGVTIGTGCVIGARSVVTKDMPAWTVCSGFPCKPLKPRQKV